MPKFNMRVTEKVTHSKVYEIEADNEDEAKAHAIEAAVQDEEGVTFVQVDDRYAEVEP